MSLSVLAGIAIFAVLVLVVIPAPRCRCVVFRFLHGGLWLLLAVVVLACALFHFYPALVPPPLAVVLDRLLERLEDHLPALPLLRPIVSPWSILAVLAVVTGLSVLRRLDSARRHADQEARHNHKARRSAAPRLLKDILTEE